MPESEWAPTLAKSGFSPRTIEAWVELFGGFNNGVVDFERRASAPVRGTVSIEAAVRMLT